MDVSQCHVRRLEHTDVTHFGEKLPAKEEKFVRSVMQYVLPRGLHQRRYDGWMNPNNQDGPDSVSWLA